ncbi:hypothetical protein [Candidatus Tisiphia endosymbiont of Hybos culiciformis]
MLTLRKQASRFPSLLRMTTYNCFVGSRLIAMTPVIFPQLLNCHDDL